jgi:hypothetical protein
MQKARAFVMILLLIFMGFGFSGFVLHAQEEDSEEEDITMETDWVSYTPELYSLGDQTFSISLGVTFPTVFLNNGKVVDHHFTPPVGGAGSLAYNYFLGSHFFLGGDIGIQFNGTLAKNTLFLIHVGPQIGWQFVFRNFEFPLSLGLGFIRHQYLDFGYSGFFMKGKVSAFFRYNSDWSFGLNTDWSWYPQRPLENGQPDTKRNMDGNFVGLTLAARYHF